MKFAVTSLVLAAVAAAQTITLSTPTGATGAIQCGVYQINWTGGQGPFDIRLLDSAQNLVEEIASAAQSSPVQWTVNEPAGQTFLLSLHDAAGGVGISGMFTIQTSSNTACLSAGAGGSSTAAGASSTPAAGGSTTGSGSSTAASGSQSATKAGSSATGSSASPTGTPGAAMHNTVGVSLVGALFAAAAALF